jgi:hypothetical protein
VKDHDVACRYRSPSRAESKTAQSVKAFGAKINFQQSLFLGAGPMQDLRKLVRVGGLQLRQKSPFVDHRGNFVTSVAMIFREKG